MGVVDTLNHPEVGDYETQREYDIACSIEALWDKIDKINESIHKIQRADIWPKEQKIKDIEKLIADLERTVA